MTCTIGVDIGTTSTIGIILNTKTNKVIYKTTRPTKLISKKTGWAEEDPSQWEKNTISILKEIGRFAQIKKISIKSLGVTGMLPALIILDKKFKPLRFSIQQSDSRTEKEIKKIFPTDFKKQEFTKITKCGVNQQLIAPKLLWIATNEPKNFKKIHIVMGSYDYINFILTGIFSIEHNWALESGLMDFRKKKFTNYLLKLGRMKKEWMPPINHSEKIIGKIKKQIIQKTKLPKDISVIAGCADHIVSAFMAGVVKPGDVLLKFGGAGDIMISSKKPFKDTRLFNDFHIIPGLYMPNGCMATSGSMLNWFIDLVQLDTKKIISHKLLDKKITKRKSLKTTCTILPYFLGEKTPIHDVHAKGTIIGLTLNHSIEDLWIAFLESVCFAFYHHIDVIRENNIVVKNFFASDGGSKSQVWMQIMSNLLQKPLKIIVGHHGSSHGAAFLAAKAVNLYSDYSQAQKFNSHYLLVKPQKKYKDYYKNKYSIYREIYLSLNNLYPKFNKIDL